MKKNNLFIALVGVFMAMGIFSCQQPAKETQVKEYPMFWTWLDYHPEKFDSTCQSLSELGLDGIVLKAGTAENYRQAVPVAKKHGLTVYAWWWTFCLLCLNYLKNLTC